MISQTWSHGIYTPRSLTVNFQRQDVCRFHPHARNHGTVHCQCHIVSIHRCAKILEAAPSQEMKAQASTLNLDSKASVHQQLSTAGPCLLRSRERPADSAGNGIGSSRIHSTGSCCHEDMEAVQRALCQRILPTHVRSLFLTPSKPLSFIQAQRPSQLKCLLDEYTM